MFNINAFQSNIAQNGILQTNKFKVVVPPPKVLQGGTNLNEAGGRSMGSVSKLLTFRAEQVKAPGITLLSDSVHRYGVGTKQKMPYNANYTDTAITFLSDGYGDIWTFWYNWINNIFGFAGNDKVVGGGNAVNSMPTYSLKYKDQYAVQMSITVFDVSGYEVMTINLYDAFPLYINDTHLNWGENNQLLRITVGITFKEFTIVGAGTNKPMSKAINTNELRNTDISAGSGTSGRKRIITITR